MQFSYVFQYNILDSKEDIPHFKSHLYIPTQYVDRNCSEVMVHHEKIR